MVQNKINIPSLLKIGNGKIRKTGKYLRDRNFNRIAIFFSAGIEPLVAAPLYEGLKEHGIEICHKAEISDINIENVVHTAFKIPARTSALLGVGGGKALDYGKYCAHILGLPYISVPTSVSNDGLCSPNASLLVGSVRKSVKASIPYGLVADLDIIATAPPATIYSGLGDMVSKVPALWDWKRAFQKKLDTDNDFAALISHNSVDILYAQRSADIHSREFLYKLTNSLVLSGVAMEIAGSSRPASGGEHLISHALDAAATNPRPHGLQVGVAAYLCALLQDNRADIVGGFLLDTGFVDFMSENPLDKRDFITALQKAPSIKPGYYTILSEPDSYARALSLLDSDDILRKIIK